MARRYAVLRPHLNEFQRRLWLGAEAAELGPGTPLQHQAESYRAPIESRRRVDAYTIGAVLPITGKYATIRKSPPIIVSGTIATIPARMADR